MYFLIGIWGSDNRLYSAIKFFLFTLVGSVVMLLGILAVYFYNHSVTGVYTFDITQFHTLDIPFDMQWWIFLAFFLGFAVKVPMFPFHTWLPDAHTDAPTAGSVILAAVLLKMGTYGFIRFSLPILPEATIAFVPLVAALSIIGIVYGALVAMAQRDWKRLVAYSSVSHMGMVMLGMFALTPVGVTGSIVQQLNHGISTGALFLLVGVVYERRHTRLIAEYGGLSKVMPVYAAVFLIMTMSSIGLPTLNGFIGEILILQGVFVVNKMWAFVAASGIVLGAAYMLWLYQRTMFGTVTNPKNENLPDLSMREFVTFVPLLLLAVWIGLYPKPFLDRLETSVDKVMMRVNSDYTPRFAAVVDSDTATRAGAGTPVAIETPGTRRRALGFFARSIRNKHACRVHCRRLLLPAARVAAHGRGPARPGGRRSAAAARLGDAGRDAAHPGRDGCGGGGIHRRGHDDIGRTAGHRRVRDVLQVDRDRIGPVDGADVAVVSARFSTRTLARAGRAAVPGRRCARGWRFWSNQIGGSAVLDGGIRAR